MDGIEKLRRGARPVIFETGLTEAPYSTAGTAVLVGYKRALYVVTARHVVNTHPIERLVVFPADGSQMPLRFSEWWDVADADDRSDIDDLLILRADLSVIRPEDRRNSHLLHLTPPDAAAWYEDRHSSRFFLFGYALEGCEVDYGKQHIHTGQFLLPARYVGHSAAAPCHELQVENPVKLNDFNGLSGSPVMALPIALGTATVPSFAGLTLRGGAEASRIHFLPAEVIMAALKQAGAQATHNHVLQRSAASRRR
jgi:hypothetical protein